MAIAFDNATASTPVTASSLTFSHTVGSISNGLLLVGIRGTTADGITGVTYAGASMTLVGKLGNGSGPSGAAIYTYLYYLLNPATGANNVVVSASGSQTINAAAASYSGVKQSGQPDASATNYVVPTTHTLTTSVTTVADNCWTMCTNSGYDGGDAPTGGTGTTRRCFETGAGSLGMFDSNGAITPAGSTSLIVNYAANQIQDLIVVMASFSPAAAAAAFTPRRALMGVGI